MFVLWSIWFRKISCKGSCCRLRGFGSGGLRAHLCRGSCFGGSSRSSEATSQCRRWLFERLMLFWFPLWSTFCENWEFLLLFPLFSPISPNQLAQHFFPSQWQQKRHYAANTLGNTKPTHRATQMHERTRQRDTNTTGNTKPMQTMIQRHYKSNTKSNAKKQDKNITKTLQIHFLLKHNTKAIQKSRTNINATAIKKQYKQ